jgi:hypothetical protein
MLRGMEETILANARMVSILDQAVQVGEKRHSARVSKKGVSSAKPAQSRKAHPRGLPRLMLTKRIHDGPRMTI